MRDRNRSACRPWLLLPLASVLAMPCVWAQKSTTPTLPGSGASVGQRSGAGSSPYGANSPYGAAESDSSEMDHRLEHSRARAREADRQKRMVEDADRLVALAARYRASITEHEHATPEDTRMLLEMEKLARSVKDRMRGM